MHSETKTPTRESEESELVSLARMVLSPKQKRGTEIRQGDA